eukprot:s539_g8.t1
MPKRTLEFWNAPGLRLITRQDVMSTIMDPGNSKKLEGMWVCSQVQKRQASISREIGKPSGYSLEPTEDDCQSCLRDTVQSGSTAEPCDGCEEEVLAEVQEAMLRWLAENKRLEDYRLVEREIQGLQLASATVDLHSFHLLLTVQIRGEAEVLLVDFTGHRSSDLRRDEAMHCVDHELVRRLQRMLVPSLPSPVLLLDFLLSLPRVESPVPFRIHILEEMLTEECWEAESDSDLLEELSINDDAPESLTRPARLEGAGKRCRHADSPAKKKAQPRPGYGPAHKVSEKLRQDWEELVKVYLKRSKSLQRVICLVDSYRGLRRDDERLWETVMDSGRQMMVVLTKADRCHPVDLHKNVSEVIAALQHLDRDLIWPLLSWHIWTFCSGVILCSLLICTAFFNFNFISNRVAQQCVWMNRHLLLAKGAPEIAYSFFLAIYSTLQWSLQRVHQSCLRVAGTSSRSGHKSGPKSRRHSIVRFVVLWSFLGLPLSFAMTELNGRGEGGDPVMGVTEATQHWMQHFISGVAKPHDIRPTVSLTTQGRPHTSIVKRSLKRAHRRALAQGFAWYKGQCYSATDFHFMPTPTESVLPSSETLQSWTQYNQQHKPRKRFACLQWNCSGLSQSKLDEIKTWLATQAIPVLVLVETRWTFSSEWVDEDWVHLHSGHGDHRGKGIMVLVSRRFCSERDIKWLEADPGRLVHVRLPGKGRPIDLVAVYQHVDTKSAGCQQQRAAWWNRLDELLQTVPQRHHLVVLGDFNCNLLESHSFSGSEWYRWNHVLTKGSQHADAGRFIQLLRFHGLVVLNSWRATDGPTYVHAGATSRIDFACVRKPHADGMARQPCYLWQAPFMGPTQQGHVPILHSIALYWALSTSLRQHGISKQQGLQAKLAHQAQDDRWVQFEAATAQIMTQALQVPRRRIQLRNQVGAIASPAEELTILKNFVVDIWGGTTYAPPVFPDAPGVPFTMQELEVALRHIPMNRCKAAPGLWNSLLLLYLHRVSEHLPIAWLRGHMNLYADDFHIGGTYYSEQDLHQLIQAFGVLLEVLSEFHLRLNTRKSVALLALAGTSHRHIRASVVTVKDGMEHLRIPLPSQSELHIPLLKQATYLGTIMTYKDCATATLKHRVSLARIAQRRLGRWLGGKHAMRVQQRFQIWRSCVFPVLCHGLFAIGISDIGIKTLQHVLYPMLRQVAGDHAFRTGHTNRQALELHHLPTPLQLLRAAANQLLTSVTQRSSALPSDDITLQISWTHLDDLIQRLDNSQDLGDQLVEPALYRQAAIHECALCGFATDDVTVFRRHCTRVHSAQVHRTHMANTSHFTINGLPVCKFCHKSFATWRSFQVHIERGCEALFSGPCAVLTTSSVAPSVYMAGSTLAASEIAVRRHSTLSAADLRVLSQTDFGTSLCHLIESRNWHELERHPEICAFLCKHCVLCNHQFGRVQELNAHFRQHHRQFWDGVPSRATLLTNTWASDSPCQYCGALFKTHLCPVWVQVAVLLIFGAGPLPVADTTQADSSASVRCEICLQLFENAMSLADHLKEQHQLQGLSFCISRDSISGQPACSHCGNLYDSLSGLRSHISQGRCVAYNPYAVAESLQVEQTWIDACTAGNMKIVLGQAMDKLRLTTRCQHCGVHYSRAADLAGHLQGAHARLWRHAQQLTLLLVSLIYQNGTCVCNPMALQHRSSHICLPLRQLSMLFCRLEGMLFAPFQVTDSNLDSMLTRQLDREFRFQLNRIVNTRTFERLWQDESIVTTLRSLCIFCGHECAPAALCQHLREAHHGSHIAVSFYIGHLMQFFLAHQLVDYQCYACHQIFNLPSDLDTVGTPETRQLLAQSHLLHNCPCLLQAAFLLTGLITDGRLHHEQRGGLGHPAGHGHVQGPGTVLGSAHARPSSAVFQSARAEKKQKRAPAGSPDDNATPAAHATSPEPTAPASSAGPAAGTPGVETRPRAEPGQTDRQLCTFFQQKSGRRTPSAGPGNSSVAGETEVIDLASDNVETTSQPSLGTGIAESSAQNLRGQTGGCSLEDNAGKGGGHTRWPLAVSGMGSSPTEVEAECKESLAHAKDDPMLHGAGRSLPRSNLSALLSESSGDQGEQHCAVEAATTSEGGSLPRTAPAPLQEQRVGPDGHGAQAAHQSAMWVGGLHPDVSGHQEEQSQRPWQGEDSIQSGSLIPDMAILLHVLSHLALSNDSNWCFANATTFCLLWTMLTVQCEPEYLGERFAALLQFLPCHNMQPVALASLHWFQEFLQSWGSFRGSQRERQQDTSEFTAALLEWLRAPAINQTWEKRLDENDRIRAFDIGGSCTPVSISFPMTHAHLPDFEFTLSDLLWRWSQVDGMTTALVCAPQILCVHLDRFYQDADGNLCKSLCPIALDATCDVPVFIGPGLRKEYLSYILVATSAHMGDTDGGHFRTALKLRPAVIHQCQPIQWLLTEDNQRACPLWQLPDWFRSCTTMFWMLRADCVYMHVYQPLPDDAPPEGSEPMQPRLDALAELALADHEDSAEMPAASPEATSHEPDDTEAAILALLQAPAYPSG